MATLEEGMITSKNLLRCSIHLISVTCANQSKDKIIVIIMIIIITQAKVQKQEVHKCFLYIQYKGHNNTTKQSLKCAD